MDYLTSAGNLQRRFILATYVWFDATMHARCKYRTLEVAVALSPPMWECDTNICLRPVRVVHDSLAASLKDSERGVVVLCECLNSTTGAPMPFNTRALAKAVFEKGRNVHPCFAIEQEYVLCDAATGQPWKWDIWFADASLPKKTAASCGIGAGHAIGREIALEHFHACLAAGLTMLSMKSGKIPAQWCFEVGPLEGLHASEELLLARFFLNVICERHGLKALCHPKPKRKCEGSACVVKYSNEQTRREDGLTEILIIFQNLSDRHHEDMSQYGKDNEKRLDGIDASAFDTFSYSLGDVDDRASVNVPRSVFQKKSGYFEDLRPAANCDPYVVTSRIHEAAVWVV